MTISSGSVAATSSVSVEPRRGVAPIIRREGITWHGGVGKEPLVIELTFENPASIPSASAEALIGIADFGAFLTWRPLTTVAVPPIPPGGRVVATAMAEPDRPSEQQTIPIEILGNRFEALMGHHRLQSAHFLGNISVFLPGSAPVQRHFQQAVGLRAGTENLVWFQVGDGITRDRYAFRVEAEQGWKVDLHLQTLYGSKIDFDLGQNTPVDSAYIDVLVCVVPKADAEAGRVVVWVRRGSAEQEVPVEFELMAHAPGTAC